MSLPSEGGKGRTPPAAPTSPRPLRWGDDAFRYVCVAAGSAVLVVAGALALVLFLDSRLAMARVGLDFFTSDVWIPNRHQYGALAFIYGTVMSSAVAMLIAVPLGVATAVFLAEIAPPSVRRLGSFLVELLAAIPSVVYGFWGLFFVAPYVQALAYLLGGSNVGGSSLLSAGLVLAIMILPYITAISFDVLRAVPRGQAQAALALGATRWQMIWTVLLPYAKPGILGASFLALGRALGETMAVTMLIGNRAIIAWSLFQPADSIASVLANQLNEATDDLHRSSLVQLGLVLLVVTVIVNSLARLLIWQVNREPASVTGQGPWRPRPAWLRQAMAKLPAKTVDRVMTYVLAACLVITLAPLFLILGYITYQGIGALSWDFFTNLPAPRGEAGGGLAHAIVGSAMLVGLATLFAVPLSLLVAIFLAEYHKHWLVPIVRFVGELLGGVPSIVIGVFAYALLVDKNGWLSLGGFSGWAGAFALGVMMIPIVMRSAEEALKLVPNSLRNASQALGATYYQTVMRVCLPAALPAIITGVFLAIARIAGETAPLLLTAYNSIWWARTPSDRTPFLAYYIYQYSQSGYEPEVRQAWAAALVLLVVVMFLNVGIRLLTGQRVIQASRAE